MAVELLGYPSLDDHAAVQEAAAAGLRAMQHLVHQLSASPGPDCSGLADLTVNRFRKVISILDRTGHARFRRGPASASSSPSTSASTSTSSAPLHDLNFAPPPDDSPAPFPVAPSSSSFAKSLTASLPLSSHTSSLTGNAEGSVTGKPPVPPSAVKPPRCPSRSHSTGVSRCHCSSKRKSRVKRTIRVPAISPKIADIPADEYSWRKYGQKPIKGSPYPRSYYKCSTVRGCPARKHVERAPEDPSMLVVTYEYEHQHAVVAPPRPLIPEA